jgi:inhibitor of cysteine peptidase
MRIFFLMLAVTLLPLAGNVFATENTEIIDELEKLSGQTISSEALEFQTFTSCEDMETTLSEFVKENFEQRRGWPMRYGRWWGMVDDMAVEADGAEAGNKATSPVPSVQSQSTDYSTTNIQVIWVDEPEILKTDGDYLYYYNQRLQKVFILRSPLNRTTATISMNNAGVVAIIAIPFSFSQVQLFLHDEQLVLLAQRWVERPVVGVIDTSSKTDVIIYDISTPTNPKLRKFLDLDGWYQDARLVGDTLYVVSQVGINRRWYGQTYTSPEDVKIEAETLLPKGIDIAYTNDESKKNLTINDTSYPYHVSVQRPTCAEMMYVLPTKESIKEYGLTPQFTLLRAIDLTDPEKELATTTTFWSTQTVHLTEKSVYLANSFWAPFNSTCPPNARCIWWGGGDQQTLIHKLALQGTTMNYVDSALLPWSPLTQRSMDEDSAGNFRILTSTRQPQQATHLITLDKNLGQLGSLLNIEPGEQFKAARFMGDKLYLVTFEQIDPLFVIDLASLSTPKIIWELKIPWFSTYLHPYAPAANGVQWLLGIGYDTTINQRWGTQTNGVKIDLYKIDYNQKDAEGNIAVTQEVTKTFWGKGSESEALQNPRLFVWNPTTKQLILPMILQDATPWKQCTTTYDSEGKVIGQDCRDNETYSTTFAGMKAIEVLPTAITEKASYDYSELLRQDKQSYDSYQGQIRPRQLSNLQFRSWYLGDVLYTINNLFVHFVVPGSAGQETYVSLDSSIDLP